MIQKLVARGFLSEALNAKRVSFLMTLKQHGNAISVIISSFEYQVLLLHLCLTCLDRNIEKQETSKLTFLSILLNND